ncbi:NHLP bacteriocin system secretion protein [Xanthobacter flavus]|uniref:NHLP bacteriocin system secretion protein n=1 Tax=Xanthobacter flavus TaxID=281 RepID=UPI0037275770
MSDIGAADEESGPQRRRQDGLHARIVLVPRAHKMLLMGVAVALLATLAWAVFDKVPTLALGRGTFVNAAALKELVLPLFPGGEGIVETINVSVDENVAAGQVLMTLRLPDLEQQIITARQSLDGATEDLSELTATLAEQKELTGMQEEARRRSISETISLLEAQRTELESMLKDQEALYARGNTTRSNAYGYRQRHEETIIELARQRSDLLAVDTRLSDARQRQFIQLSEARRKVAEQRRALTALEERHTRLRLVTAPRAGFVNSLLTSEGHSVGPRDIIMTLSTGSRTLEMIGFVDAQQAPRIRLGMASRIVPSTVRKAEYGAMMGRISFISRTPISAAEIDALLSDKQLTAYFTQAGPVFLVRVVPVLDPATPSGFAWTSNQGPPFAIEAGTLAGVEVVTKEQAPITLVMPAMRELMGLL